MVSFAPENTYAFSPIGTQVYEPNLKNKETAFKAGALYLNRYHQSYNQMFYTVDAKIQKKVFTRGKLVVDAFGIFKAAGEGKSSYSVKEFYYKSKLNSKLTYSLGRKIIQWSTLEGYLPTGFWNNAWDYDKSAPSLEGNIGAFLNYKIPNGLAVTLFASPISAPKLVSHYNLGDDGTITANTPWVSPPPSEIDYQGEQYAVKEFVELDIANLLLEPQVGAVFDWSTQNSLFKLSYLYGPTKDFDLEIDFALNAESPDTSVDVTITPRRVRAHKIGLEFGQKWTERSRTTVSANYSQRESSLEVDPNNLKSHIGLSSGAVYQIAHEQFFRDKKIKLRVHAVENTSTTNISNGELDELLLSSHAVSFRYVRGAGGSIGYLFRGATRLTAYGYYDVELDGVLANLKLNFKVGKVSLDLGYNVVEALSSDSKGFYKNFRENDSYHLGVAYVF